ncbi:hypothetical protein AB6A40_003092 [Gnathostoma spinigerum]|uniref:Galectin n=1 Tax=Gnathostoma spinigerum TaxID=75299 RepID=A0ABD6E8M5_9BILA
MDEKKVMEENMDFRIRIVSNTSIRLRYVTIMGPFTAKYFYYGGALFATPLRIPWSLKGPCSRLDIMGFFYEQKATNVRLNINFLDENETEVFHISMRFNEGVIVRNVWNNGWGVEDRSGAWVLSPQKMFTLTMFITEERGVPRYHINIDHMPYTIFEEDRRRPAHLIESILFDEGTELLDFAENYDCY